MAETIGGVNVKIGADTKGLKKGVQEAKGKIGELRGAVNSGAGSFAKYGLAAAAAGAAVTAHMVNTSAKAAKEIQNLSRISNEASSRFQQLAYGARSVGIEQEKFADILKDVNDRVGDFVTTGGGPMVDFFEQIAPKVGVTAQQFKNLSGKDALQLYVDTLQKANVNQQEMTFYLEAMASDATALIPLLKDGGAGFAAMSQEAEALGLALSDVQIEQLAQAGKGIETAQGLFSSFTKHLSAEFAPAINTAVELMKQMTKEAGGAGNVASNAFSNMVNGAGFVMDAVHGVKVAFEVASRAISGAFAGALGGVLKIVRGIVEISNAISFGSMTPMLEELREFEKINLGFASETLSDINNTLMDERPSVELQRRIALAKQLSETAAAAAVAQPQGVEGDGAGFNKEAKDKQLEDEKAWGIAMLEVQAEYMELARIARENGLAAEDFIRMEREQRELDSLKKIWDSNVSYERKISAMKRASAKARNQVAANEARGALEIMSGFNKTAFKVNKAFGISDALISTYQGIASALKLPFPVNIAAAAKTAALGFKQVSAIRSQSYSSGGGGGSVSSNVSGGLAATPGSVLGGAAGGEAQQQNINISGISATDLISGGQLVQVLNEAIGDGANITGVN